MVLVPPTPKSFLFILNVPLKMYPSLDWVAVNGNQTSFVWFLMVSFPKTNKGAFLFEGVIFVDAKRITGYFLTSK